MSDKPGADLILYQTEDGRTRLEGGTVWLSQALLAELYQAPKQNISLHLKNMYEDDELVETAVVKDCLTTAGDGKRYREPDPAATCKDGLPVRQQGRRATLKECLMVRPAGSPPHGARGR